MTKVVTLDEAAAVVTDGGHLALTGFAITRNCVAMAHALVRAGRRDLTLSQVIGGIETDLLAASGCLRRLNYSGGSLDRFGSLNAVNRGIGSGELAVSEYSSLSITLRFHAAGLGLPYLPTRSMLGSDLLAPLLAAGDVSMGEDPFDGGPIALLSPLVPDVAIVHADVADEQGNATIGGPTWALRETAFAARSVVVICEELVSVGSINPNHVLIPGAIVDAVAVVPRGAHPTAVYDRYDFDRAHLESYVKLSRDGAEAHDTYIEKYIRGVGTHEEYLELVEVDR